MRAAQAGEGGVKVKVKGKHEPQRRKDAKKSRKAFELLCAFAPLRLKDF
jgi:hypothetical protein